MDVTLVVLRLRRHLHLSRDFCSPQDFEILLQNVPGSSKLLSLLKYPNTKRTDDPIELVLRVARRIQGIISRRAIPIPIYTSTVDVPCSSSTIPSPSLICLPLTELDFDAEKFSKHSEFYNFAHVLNDALNESPLLDAPTRHFIRRIEEWLAIEQRGSIGFLSSLFYLKPSTERVRLCVHNPAYDPHLAYFCRSVLGQNGSTDLRYNSSYLEEAVKQSNKTRAKMIQMDKYDQYQMNPLYGAKHSYKRKLEAPDYFAKGKKIVRRQKTAEVKSPKELWELHYPLHKAAFDGDAQRTKMLLAQGWDPNAKDDDTWTPLHYAAFYNRLDVCSELLLHSKIDVNITNKTGITALHFAALNAFEYVVELILQHSRVQTDIKDNTGRTAYDLCANMPKKEWQDVANLLRKRMETSKIEVHLSSGLTLQVKVEDIKEATAGEVREQIFKELGLDKSAEPIFAIWIMNSLLSLQLNAEQKILKTIEKWKEYIEKWGDESNSPHLSDEEDPVRIVFQRDAKTFVRPDEEFAVKQNNAVTTLLFEEAQKNFLRGLLPCQEREGVIMAAIIFQRMYSSDHKIDESVLPNILPAHMIPAEKRKRSTMIKSIQTSVNNEKEQSQLKLERIFLNLCWSKNVYGCTTFKATMYVKKPSFLYGVTEVYVGINDWGLIVINSKTFKICFMITIENITTLYNIKPYIEIVGQASNNETFNVTFATKQAHLINNLIKMIKNKKESKRIGNNLLIK